MSEKKEKLTQAILTNDGQVLMRRPDGHYEQANGQTDWARLAAMENEEIASGEIPELTEAFWVKAKVTEKKTAGQRMIASAKEALAFAEGQENGAVVHIAETQKRTP